MSFFQHPLLPAEQVGHQDPEPKAEQNSCLAKRHPGEYHVFVGGDFNFGFPDKPAVRLPSYEPEFNIGTCYSFHSSGLARTLAKAVRVQHDSFTHFNSGKDHLNDTDHIFLGHPSWLLLNMDVRVSVRCPMELWSKGVSDHGIVSVFARQRCRKSSTPPRIASWVTKCPRFCSCP